MKNAFNKLVVLVILLVFMFPTSVFAEPVEMFYDDGSAEWGIDFYWPMTFKAVKFEYDDLGYTKPIKITAVKTYWTQADVGDDEYEKYRFSIYNSDREMIYGWSDYIFEPTVGWNTLDISDLDIVLDDDFYVVINAPINLYGDQIDMGHDINTGGNTYIYIYDNLYFLGMSNFMIRAFVEEQNSIPTIESIDLDTNPVEGGTELTITSYGVVDLDEEPLSLVCSYSVNPTIDMNDCTNYPQNENYPYTDLTCTIISDDNNEEDAIYCRVYDGTDYSNEVYVLSTDDALSPDVELFLGDEEGTSTDYDNDGEVFATLTNFDASGIDNCIINWGDGTGDVSIDPVQNSESYLYSDGEYTVTYTCEDIFGFDSTSTDTIIVDTVSPEIEDLSIEEIPFDMDGDVILSWDSAVDENPIAYYEIWRMDTHNDWEVIDVIDTILADFNPPPMSFSYQDSGLEHGETYTWFVRAYDVADNYGDSDEESTTIDTENPAVQIVTPESGSYLNNEDVELTVKYSSIFNVDCIARLDDGDWFDMDNDGDMSGIADLMFVGLADGVHYIEVECEDEPGLTSTDVSKFVIDTVSPEVTIELGDEKNSPSEFDNDRLVYAMLTNEDEEPSSGYNCEINWDGEWFEIESSDLTQSYEFNSDGEKTVEYKCTDRAGNEGNSFATINVDTVSPESTAQIISETCNEDWSNDDVLVELTATDDNSGVESLLWSLSGEKDSFIEYTEPILITEEGETIIYYYATDNANNKEIPHNKFLVRIDRTQPVVEITFPIDTAHLANPEVLFQGIAYDVYAVDDAGFSLMNLPSGIDYIEIQIEKRYDDSIVLPWTVVEGSAIWQYNWTESQNLEYRVLARVVDNACNYGNVDEVDFTVQELYDFRYYTEEEIDQMIDDLNNQIEDLEDSLDATEEEIADLWNELTLLQMVVLEFYDDFEDLVGDVVLLTERLDTLENQVEHLWLVVDQIVVLEKEYDQVNHELFLRGSGAPEDANYAVFEFQTSDGNFVFEEGVEIMEDRTFENAFDVSDWPIEGMNIYVKFYEEQDWVMPSWAVWETDYEGLVRTFMDVWDGLLSELEYGFEPIDEKSFSTYYMNEPVTRIITYSVMPHVDGEEEEIYDGGLYNIVLTQIASDSGEEISQVIEECVFLYADRENSINSEIEIPAPGNYYVRLEATNDCEYFEGNGEHFVSNSFVISLHDLSFEMPESELIITNPDMYDRDESGIYWVQSDQNFYMTGRINLNGAVLDRSYCELQDWTYGDYGLNMFNINMNEFEDDEYGIDFAECSTTFSAVDGRLPQGILGNGAEGIYEIRMYVDTTPSVDPEDVLFLGVDDTPPVIEYIFPTEGDAVSKISTFFAHVTDFSNVQETSGVYEAFMSLHNKLDDSLVWNGELIYNDETDNWETSLDTAIIEDGSYDVRVTARDTAFNTVNVEFDPIVDNTEPVIEVLSDNINDGTIYEGGLFYMRVNTFDDVLGIGLENVAGVDYNNVYIEFLGTDVTCDMVFVSELDGNVVFETDETCFVPVLSNDVDFEDDIVVRINAGDLTNNVNMGTLDLSLTIEDPIIHIEELDCEAEECIIVESIVQEEGMTIITLLNLDEENNHTTNMTIVVPGAEPGDYALWTIFVNPGERRSIYIIENFVVSALEAEISSIMYDPNTEELSFIGDGHGLQEILIYVGNYGNPQTITFDPGNLLQRNYFEDTKTVFTLVEFGSPHTMILSWYIPPVVNEEPVIKKKSGGGGSAYKWVCDDWSECSSSGSQTRVCINERHGEGDYRKPAEVQECEYIAPTESEINNKKPVENDAGGLLDNLFGNANNVNEESKSDTPNDSPQNQITGFVTGDGSGSKGIAIGLAIVLAIVGLGLLVNIWFRKH